MTLSGEHEILPETALAHRASVVEIVRAYDAACADIRAAFAMAQAAERSINAVVTLGKIGDVSIRDRQGEPIDFAEVDKALAYIRCDVWSAIVERLEIRRMLSIARAEELDKQLDRDNIRKPAAGSAVALPEITEESVYAFAHGYMVQLDAMIAEAVLETFEFLRPPGSKYRTNTELEIGERVILTRTVTLAQWGKGRFKVHHHDAPRLTALENTFRSLDGKGGALPTSQSELQTQIETFPEGRGATAYFGWKGHKNGTLHLLMLRPDLLAKLNQIAGGMRLRPQAKKGARK